MASAPHRVLVTGGAGLVGSAVVDELVAAGRYDVIRILDTAEPRAPAGATWCPGDVRSAGDLSKAAAGMDAIVHAAAIPRPGGSAPEEIMSVNVLGTFHTYQAAAEHGISRVVQLSSSAVIGTDWSRGAVMPRYLPIDEDHPRLAQDPYGLSKAMGEDIAEYAWRAFGIGGVVLRPPWVATPADLRELTRTRGRAVDGVHHYSYVDVRDLARAVRLSLGLSRPGVTTLFVAADDSTLPVPLSQVFGGLATPPVRGADGLDGTRGGITARRAGSVLGWRAEHGWRSPGSPRPGAAEQ